MSSRTIWTCASIYFFLVVGLYAVGFWLPSIIHATGVSSPLRVGMLSAVPYGIGAALMLPISRRSDRAEERHLHFAAVAFIGCVGLWASQYAVHSTMLSVLTMTLATSGIVTALPLFWTLPYSRLTGRGAAAGLALVNSVGNLGGFVGPYSVGALSQLAGSPSAAMGWLSLTLFAAAIIALILRGLREPINQNPTT